MDIRQRLHLSGMDSHAPELARKWGLGLEVTDFCYAPMLDDPATLPAVREKMAGIDHFWLHAPFAELAPCAIDPLVRQVTEKRYRQAADMALDLGVRRLIIHGGFVPQVYFPEWYVEQSVIFWRDFLRQLPPDMTIALENVMEPEPRLLAEIARAKHHIHIQYYIFCDDETGRRLRDALVEKVRQGVEVRILYDDVGCSGVKKSFFEGMRREGIEAFAFLHVKFPLFTSKVNYRNHRKIAVIDGCVGFIGGMNIADRYVRGTEWGSWRDTHFRIEGSGAAGLQASFLSDWSATTKRHIAGAEYYPAAERHTDDILQIVPSGPFGKWRALLQADSYAVSNARKRIWIQTPYYLPSDVLNSALQVAALAGIDVRLMLPTRSDSKVVDLASHSYLDDMMKAGVKILFYKPGFLHSKLLIIDNSLTVIGSANMDFRSFEHNFEVNAFVYDREFTARMAGVFEDDASRCHALTPGEWFNRPRPRRWAESLMRVFSPLL